MEGMFNNMHMTVIHGQGKLIDAHTIDVDGKKITAEYIVLGTGERATKQNIFASGDCVEKKVPKLTQPEDDRHAAEPDDFYLPH